MVDTAHIHLYRFLYRDLKTVEIEAYLLNNKRTLSECRIKFSNVGIVATLAYHFWAVYPNLKWLPRMQKRLEAKKPRFGTVTLQNKLSGQNS
jgi:hypothetical protein